MLTALYIHIPFCNQICTYCDFHKELATETKKTRYINALLKELTYYKQELQHIKTIYIGGGTPSALDIELLKLLLSKITKTVNMQKVEEFTIECNPNDITEAKALLFFKHGINRISFGLQTFNNNHLSFLNRSHTEENIYQGISILRKAAIDNINVDMIFSLPNQTMEELQSDLEKIIALDVPHISYYSLIFEEKTKLYHLYMKNKVSMQTEDLEADMYNMVIDTLTASGYDHYEISNFSKNDHQSMHNKVYWKNQEYLGLGSGAHSLYKGKRFYNERNVRHYIEYLEEEKLPHRDFEVLEPLREEMIMGLRLMEGVNLKDVEMKYNISILKEYPEVQEFIDNGILELDKNQLKFSRKGLLLGNLVFSIF